MSEGLAQGPYVAVRVGFKPANLWTEGTELITEPPPPPRLLFLLIIIIIIIIIKLITNNKLIKLMLFDSTADLSDAISLFYYITLLWAPYVFSSSVLIVS